MMPAHFGSDESRSFKVWHPLSATRLCRKKAVSRTVFEKRAEEGQGGGGLDADAHFRARQGMP